MNIPEQSGGRATDHVAAPRSNGESAAPRRRDRFATMEQTPVVGKLAFTFLRAVLPVVPIPRPAAWFFGVPAPAVFVSRAGLVREVLARDDQFTIAEVNGPRIDLVSGPFILGMDRGPTRDRELALLHRCLHPDDPERVANLVSDHADQVLAGVAEAGELEVADHYARPVALAVADQFFGVPGPDPETMSRWMRVLFDYAFVSSDATARGLATSAAPEFRAYLEALIEERRAVVSADGDASTLTVLDRMIVAADGDVDVVRRNIAGLVVGAVDTTAKATCHAVWELLQRPDACSSLVAAARDHDLDGIRGHVHEALRFRPHQPVVVRYCATGTRLGRHRIRAGRTTFVGTWSARFDGREVERPRAFDPSRDTAGDLTYGGGPHECFGRVLNERSIPTLVSRVVTLPDVQSHGRLEYAGPFPSKLVVRFAPHAPSPGTEV